VKKTLEAFFLHRQSAAEWTAMFDTALNALQTSGLVSGRPFGLTEKGQQQALSFLGLESVPPRLNWQTLKNKYLVAHALGLPAASHDARQRLADKDGLRAMILKTTYNLPTGEAPTLGQALNAMAWRQLEIASDQNFTRTSVLARSLDLPASVNAKNLQEQLPASAVAARTSRPDELRLAVIRRWLDGGAESRLSNADTPAHAPMNFDLTGFAEAVQEAARSNPTGRFGQNKVFIAHVWQTLQHQNAFAGMEEAEFKRRLTEANHAGLLSLSRADLVEAMDPDDVRASETPYLNATFHFVQI
jgi:hypothetical protein